MSGYDDQGQLVYSYINVQTGEVTGAVPDGYFQERDEAGRGYTWEGDTMTVYADDGQTYTIDTTGLGNYCRINGDRILFSWNGADIGAYSSITDLSGKVIFQYPGRSLSFVATDCSEISLICCQPAYFQEQTVVLTRDGAAVASGVSGSVRQWGDRLLFADSTSYHLTDLAGRDLIRLPRLSYQAD